MRSTKVWSNSWRRWKLRSVKNQVLVRSRIRARTRRGSLWAKLNRLVSSRRSMVRKFTSWDCWRGPSSPGSYLKRLPWLLSLCSSFDFVTLMALVRKAQVSSPLLECLFTRLKTRLRSWSNPLPTFNSAHSSKYSRLSWRFSCWASTTPWMITSFAISFSSRVRLDGFTSDSVVSRPQRILAKLSSKRGSQGLSKNTNNPLSWKNSPSNSMLQTPLLSFW